MSASSVHRKWTVLLASAGLFVAACAGDSLATSVSRPYQPSARTQHLVLPRVFKADLRKGYVAYVFLYPQWQNVRVLFYRDRRGRFRVSKGVEYSVSSESGIGERNAWPDLSARVEGSHVSAHFGPLGSIDMHFVPIGGSRRYRPYCGGKAVRFARGHYEGRIRFAGGDGHPPVKASVGQIAPFWELEERCTGGVVDGPPSLPGAQLQAGSVHSDTPSFSAFKNAPDEDSRMFAYINEFWRGVSMIRFAGIFAPPSAFMYSQSFDKATVEPPAPFLGVGFYDEDRARRQRWSGDLSVDLPGREHVSLTRFPLLAGIHPARWVPPHRRKRG